MQEGTGHEERSGITKTQPELSERELEDGKLSPERVRLSTETQRKDRPRKPVKSFLTEHRQCDNHYRD
jgi:hypothetical protein